MRKVVLLSGGVDSALILARLLRAGGDVLALCFDYGQPARSEVLASEALADYYGVKWCCPSFSVGSGEGWGFDDTTEMNQASQIVLRNRNAMFLALASAYGLALYIGAIKDDHEVFQDCRQGFFDKMGQVLGVTIETPLIKMTKAEVMQEARDLGVPLDLCVSCYRGTSCGRCLSCVERLGS